MAGMASGYYRILAAGGMELEAGSCDARVADGALLVEANGGGSLHVPFGNIAAIGEPKPFTMTVTLADGTAIELTRLGTMRTQLLAELREGRAGDAAKAAGAVGKADIFTGTTRDLPVEVHVHEDALLVVADDGTQRIGFSFVAGIAAENYAVEVSLTGGQSLVVTRLGRRTGELVSLLEERVREARSRTAAFLGSLLPGLDPMARRAAAALLRDGVAAPAHALDAIHPEVTATLLRVATLPGRLPAVAALAQHVLLAIGFRQLHSVRRPARGGRAWQDPAITPHIGQHDSPGGLVKGGLAGALAAGALEGVGPGGFGPPGGFGGPYGGGFGYRGHDRTGGWGGPFGGGPDADDGGFGNFWAYRALATGVNWNAGVGVPHQMTPRANVQRGLLTPATEDLAALTATGGGATVLAFALFSTARGRVAYEVLNFEDPLTFVYEADGDARAVINQALDAGFQADEVHAAGRTGLTAAIRNDPAATLLSSSLVAQVPHGEDWQRQIAALLG